MPGGQVSTGAAAGIRNVPVAVTAIVKFGQADDTQTDITIGQGECASGGILRNGHINVIGRGNEVILSTGSVDIVSFKGVVQMGITIAFIIAAESGIVVASHLGNGHVQALQGHTDGFAGFVQAILVTGNLTGLNGDLIAADHLIGSTRSCGNPEDVVARFDGCGIYALFTGQKIPGGALIVADCHLRNGAACSGRQLQLPACSGEVQGVKLCIPGPLGVGVVRNIAAALCTAAGIAVNAKVDTVIMTANLYHHQAGTGRIGGTVGTVIVAARHFYGLVGHFNDSGAFTDGLQFLPVALTGRIGVRIFQTHDTIPGENGVSKFRSNDPVVIADRNDLPGPVGLQKLALTRGHNQIVPAVDIQQDTVLCDAAVGLSGSGVVVQTPGVGFIPIGIGNRQILLAPSQIACLCDLSRHGNLVNEANTTGFRVTREGVGGSAVAVILFDLGIHFRGHVILAGIVIIKACSGRGRNRDGNSIIQSQFQSNGMNFCSWFQYCLFCQCLIVCIHRSRCICILLTCHEQVFTVLACSGFSFTIGNRHRAFQCAFTQIHQAGLYLPHGDRGIRLCRERHTAPAFCTHTDKLEKILHLQCIMGIAHRCSSLFSSQFLSGNIVTICVKAVHLIENRGDSFRHFHCDRLKAKLLNIQRNDVGIFRIQTAVVCFE